MSCPKASMGLRWSCALTSLSRCSQDLGLFEASAMPIRQCFQRAAGHDMAQRRCKMTHHMLCSVN